MKFITTKYYLILAIAMVILLSGFKLDNPVKMPEKKIKRAITKTFNTSEYELYPLTDQISNEVLRVFKIEIGYTVSGNLILNRVYSCRQGGCSADVEEMDIVEYEYFDYFMIIDTTGSVRVATIYNYEATRGHEVMNPGWLKQFKGHKYNDELSYGSDIDAISGATVSAKAFIEEVKAVMIKVEELN